MNEHKCALTLIIILQNACLECEAAHIYTHIEPVISGLTYNIICVLMLGPNKRFKPYKTQL